MSITQLGQTEPQDSTGTKTSLVPAPENWISDHIEELGRRVSNSVYEIDCVLHAYQLALQRAQPCLPGRIAICWWRHKNKPGRAPYVAVWQHFANGVWHADILSARRLSHRRKRKGPFSPMTHLVQQLLKETKKLMDKREQLLAAVGIAERSLSLRLKNTERLCNASSVIADVIRTRIEEHPERKRLNAATRNVGATMISEVDDELAKALYELAADADGVTRTHP